MKKVMLKKFFAVLALSAFISISCSVDSSGAGPTKAEVTGDNCTITGSKPEDAPPTKAEVTDDNQNQKGDDWADDEESEVTAPVNSNEDGELSEIPDSAEGLKAFTSLSANDITESSFTSSTVKYNVIVNADSEKTVSVEKKSKTVGGVKYKKRIKLGGTGSKSSRSIVIYVGANQKGTLRLDLASSDSNVADRALMANDVNLGNAPAKGGSLSGEVQADGNGYIAIYSAKDGINIYGLYWSTGSSSEGGIEKKTSSEAVTPVLDNSALAPEYKNGLKVGMRTNISSVDTDTIKNVLFVSPNGKADGEGTKQSPMDIQTAVSKIPAGGAVVLKGGVYKLSKTLSIAFGNDGSEGARKYLLPESGKTAVLDFSTQPTADSARGLQLDGSFWHIYGITCYNAGDNGMYVTGSNNIVERCLFQANQDTGLQIARRSKDLSDKKDWPANNLILNCTSFDNKDDKTGENADGFASKLTCGDGNVFDGCISYANCDDGWDLYAKPATGPIGVVTIRNCVAFQNGKTTSGANYANGDMNGFKLGGSNNQCPTPHIIENSVAFENGKDGFTDNGNGGALNVSNCTSYANINSNFNFYRTYAGGVFKKLVSMIGSVSPAQVDKFGGKSTECTVAAKISDSIYLTDKKKKTFNYVTSEATIFNGDKVGEGGVADLYNSEMKSTVHPLVSLDVDAKCRNPDGTVNLSGYLEIKEGSKYAGMGAKFGDEAAEVLSIDLATK